MRAEEMDAGGKAALSDRSTTNGASCRPLSANESVLSEAAPRAVREAFSSGDEKAGWKAWRRHLQRRKRPISPTRCYPSGSMLAWSLLFAPPPRLDWLLRQLGPERDRRRVAREQLAELAGQWRNEASAGHSFAANGSHPVGQSSANGHSNGQPIHPRPSTHASAGPHPSPLTSLAWLHLLVGRPELFSAKLWWQVLSRLLEIARQPTAGVESDPLGHQLRAGELPVSLAALLPEVDSCRALSSSGAAALTLGMAEILDGEGLPQSRYHQAFQPLIACWSRCRLIAGRLNGGCWNEAAEAQFPLALREAVRLAPLAVDAPPGHVPAAQLRNDNGTPSLTRRSSLAQSSQSWLADVVADLTRDKLTRRLINAVVGKRRTRRALMSEPQRLSAPAVHSEWAELAILRTDWSRRATRVALSYAEQAVRMQLTFGAKSFLVGPWSLDVRADGNMAAPTGGWREICWVSDDDGDYLELEIKLSQSLRVQRQILLARKDQFLFLADAVLGDEPRALAYCGRWQLAGQITASSASETVEVLLAGDKARALVLPLALSEWRSDSRAGTLGVSGGGLELRQSCIGRRLYAPLWIDLSRRRADKPFTWRQLTVADQRQIQPRDVAAGYRVQFGRRQSLIYRSLAEPANRTLLGKNLSTDFLVARFRRDGETETIVEIE